MGRWYKTSAVQGHLGAGKGNPLIVYTFVNNPPEALEKCKKIIGIKRRHIPDVIQLDESECRALEERITRSRFSLEIAKRNWYCEGYS